MHEDYRKNIFCSELNYMGISLLSSKIHVLIVGGGTAGLIKAKTFSKRGCRVTVVSTEFKAEFSDLKEVYSVQLLQEKYQYEQILDKHLVVIATEVEEVNEKIKEDCEKHYKLYLTCSDFRKGLFLTPYHGEIKNLSFTLHTRGGSPKTTMFVANKIFEAIKPYDDFIGFTCNLRKRIKAGQNKKEIMEFITSEDFYFFYNRGAQNKVLEMFYGGIEFEFKDCNTKE